MFCVANFAQDKPANAAVSLKVVADKADAVYKTGDKVKFLVSVMEKGNPLEGKKIEYTIHRDGSAEAQKGSIISKSSPVEIETSLDTPGFILCTVSFAGPPKADAAAGAGVSPLEIKASGAVPADLKEFWQKKLEELKKIPMNAKMDKVELEGNLKEKMECFDIRADCYGGVPVSGYYVRPLNAKEKSCPAIVTYQGAGVRSSNKNIWHAQNGMISLDINAHGIENGKPKEFYDELIKGKLANYARSGSDDREKTYFLGMFLRVIRALEFIKSQPEWDGKTLIVQGGSQGGAQSLVAAALDPQITLCTVFVPAMCNQQEVLFNCRPTWPNCIIAKDGKAVKPDVVKAMSYYDPSFLAPEIKAETFVSVGFIDTTCTPTAVYSMYNNLRCKKSIMNGILVTHTVAQEASKEANARIAEHIREMKTK